MRDQAVQSLCQGQVFTAPLLQLVSAQVCVSMCVCVCVQYHVLSPGSQCLSLTGGKLGDCCAGSSCSVFVSGAGFNCS